MSSSASRRIYRPVENDDDVFVVGESVRSYVPVDGPVSTVANLLDGARRRGEHVIAEAEAQARIIIAGAESEVAAARAAGFDAGFASAEASVQDCLDTIRLAATGGLAVRQGMIDEAMPAIARAVAMACRRVVGAAFAADPALTADACADAIRAASGQQVISIRVNPDALDEVRSQLVDVAEYVRPDSAIDLGGCVIDLRNGTIDATLDSRLDLMELALRSAGGGDS